MKRLLLFVHFNPHGKISDHVVYMVRAVAPLFARVRFISNSPLKAEDQTKIMDVCHSLVCRQNKGYDFGAWRDALLEDGWDSLNRYDSITLMNDSCFGPLVDLSEVYWNMESRNPDFWGITKHLRFSRIIAGKKRAIPEHIQSYFLVFNKQVVASEAFQSFWEKQKNYKKITDTIHHGEVRLTQKLLRAGFQFDTFINIEQGKGLKPDLSLIHPGLLLEKGVPFLKVKSFFYKGAPAYIKSLVKKYSTYDVGLIDKHFFDTFSPDESVHLIDNRLFVGFPSTKQSPKLRAAVHIHVYYLDVFQEMLHTLSDALPRFDWYITTDTSEKKDKIKSLLAQSPGLLVKEIRLVVNRGRDIGPWLQMAEKLSAYDVAGHFHTKKTLRGQQGMAASWLNEIINTLIVPQKEIMAEFFEDESLGVVIPDIPLMFRRTVGVMKWDKTIKPAREIWSQMNCKKNVPFEKIIAPIMSYGSMFWYRPAALQPLVDLRLKAEDFPEEPMPADGTLAHAIESLPVYLAWEQGFHYKITIHPDYVLSGFDNKPLIRLMKKNKEITKSTTWFIGRLITWLPGMVISWLKKKTLK